MKQRKIESIIEASVNTCSGVLVAYLVFHYMLAPALGIPITHAENIAITSVLTVVSVARGYFWRRFFANDFHKVVHSMVKRAFKRKERG